jgi:hypothetical protein
MMTMYASFLSSFSDLAAALLPFEPKHSRWREPYLIRETQSDGTQKREEAMKSPIKRHQAPSSSS